MAKTMTFFAALVLKGLKEDVKNLESHLYPTRHFALESFGDKISGTIRDFLDRKVDKAQLAER